MTTVELLKAFPVGDPRRADILRQLGQQNKAIEPKPSKYRNVRTEVDGILFDSKREAKHYGQIKQMKQAGLVLWFIRQVPFHLPGGVKWVADFLLVTAEGVRVVDSKGMRTKTYRLKKRQVEALYPIKIEEW